MSVLSEVCKTSHPSKSKKAKVQILGQHKPPRLVVIPVVLPHLGFSETCRLGHTALLVPDALHGLNLGALKWARSSGQKQRHEHVDQRFL